MLRRKRRERCGHRFGGLADLCGYHFAELSLGCAPGSQLGEPLADEAPYALRREVRVADDAPAVGADEIERRPREPRRLRVPEEDECLLVYAKCRRVDLH